MPLLLHLVLHLALLRLLGLHLRQHLRLALLLLRLRLLVLHLKARIRPFPSTLLSNAAAPILSSAYPLSLCVCTWC